MGMVVAGRWINDDDQIEAGAFVRRASQYDLDLGADVVDGLTSEPGRYHLIASLSCPWSHRTLIMHQFNDLRGTVSVQIAGGLRVEGYAIDQGQAWQVPGTDQRLRHVHQLYHLSDPAYTGRASVPILWDALTQRIVSNDSAKIMRAFDAARHKESPLELTLMPAHLLDAINALNDDIYRDLSNAVYRAGLAERQEAYDDAVDVVFAMLDLLEERLSCRRYLFGAVVTEADWRLFPTLARFDAVYATHFKCTRRRLVDYPNLWGYARDLYSWRGIADTVDLAAILEGYYRYDGEHNPFEIIAAPPDIDWQAPHDRTALGPAKLTLRTGKAVSVEPTTQKLIDE